MLHSLPFQLLTSYLNWSLLRDDESRGEYRSCFAAYLKLNPSVDAWSLSDALGRAYR